MCKTVSVPFSTATVLHDNRNASEAAEAGLNPISLHFHKSQRFNSIARRSMLSVRRNAGDVSPLEKSVRSSGAVNRTWLVPVYKGRNPESKKLKDPNQIVHGGVSGMRIVI